MTSLFRAEVKYILSCERKFIYFLRQKQQQRDASNKKKCGEMPQCKVNNSWDGKCRVLLLKLWKFENRKLILTNRKKRLCYHGNWILMKNGGLRFWVEYRYTLCDERKKLYMVSVSIILINPLSNYVPNSIRNESNSRVNNIFCGETKYCCRLKGIINYLDFKPQNPLSIFVVWRKSKNNILEWILWFYKEVLSKTCTLKSFQEIINFSEEISRNKTSKEELWESLFFINQNCLFPPIYLFLYYVFKCLHSASSNHDW